MKKLFSNSIIFVIKIYQQLISPLFPSSCRYYPSCSNYAIDAVTKKGVVRGIFLSVWRILCCNPFSKGGYDPVE